jgi:hypothetical protein
MDHLQRGQQRRLLRGWQAAACRSAALNATVVGATARRDRNMAAAVLQEWRAAGAAQRRRRMAGGAVARRRQQSIFAGCLSVWLAFLVRKQQSAAARSYAASRIARTALLAWRAAALDAALRRSRAHERGANATARKAGALLSATLQAWRMHAGSMAGATRMLRRQLVGTLGGAFQEWRAAAAERAYWRRVRTLGAAGMGLGSEAWEA